MADKTNIKFKRGLQASLASATIEDGSFYLTTDTNRLYVGVGSDLRLLNSIVKQYATLAAWKAATQGEGTTPATEVTENGDFAYIADQNVFAVKENGTWRQVNPDTYIKTLATTAAAEDSGATVKVTTTGTLNRDTESGQTVTSNVSIGLAGGLSAATADGKTTITGSVASIADSVSNGVATITLSNSNSTDTSSVKIDDSTNVKIAKDGDTITVAAEDYRVSGATATVADGKLTVGVTSSSTLALDSSNKPLTETQNAVTKAFKFTYGKDSNGAASANTLLGAATGTSTTEYITNLDVYTTGEIDAMVAKKFEDLNAVHYQGTVSSADFATKTADADVGYMYMAADSITLANGTAKQGDLIIKSAANTWEIVPSGDDIDSQYAFVVNATNSSVTLQQTQGTTTSNVGSLKIQKASTGTGDAAVDLIGVSSTANGSDLTVSISHAAVTATKTADTAATKVTSFDIITPDNLTFDAGGHLTGYHTKNLTIAQWGAEHVADADKLTVTAAGGVQTAATKYTIRDENGNSISGKSDINIAMKSETLDLSVDATNKDALHVDLVWGTF